MQKYLNVQRASKNKIVCNKLLRIYQTRLETDNLSTKNGHFIELFSRYKDDWPCKLRMIQKRWSIYHFEGVFIYQIVLNSYQPSLICRIIFIEPQ